MLGLQQPSPSAEHVLGRLNPYIRMRARQWSPQGEQADTAQELRLSVVEALPKHDPSKATAAGFGAMVVDRSGISLARKRNAAKRTPPSPLEPIDERTCTVNDDTWSGTDLQIDVHEVLESLKPEYRSFADALMEHGTVPAAACALGIGLCIARRRRDELRLLFQDRGLDVYLK